jgi:uncharacterized membrane protein YebE (DUF533 family)
MAESAYLSVIKVWAAMTWADGKVHPHEKAAMTKLIAIADLGDDDRKVAMSYLDTKVELDTTDLAALGQEAREGIFRAAARLSAIDQDVADEEVGFLEKLQKGLGIDDATAEKLIDAVANK